MELNEITASIIESGITVHRALGPGLLESTYHACLKHDLTKRGFAVSSQVAQPVHFDGVTIDLGYRIDLLVQDAVVVELKAIQMLLPVHEAQLLTYLRHGGFKIGLLMNFHAPRLVDGVRRVVNNF